MRVTMLMGGANTERDVSLSSGVAVADALRRAGHEVASVDTALPIDEPDFTRELEGEVEVREEPPSAEELAALAANRDGRILPAGVLDACRAAEVTVVMAYGDEGESGHVQAVLDWAGLDYVGPGPTACGLSFDKVLTKRVARDAGVPTAGWATVREGPFEDTRQEQVAAVAEELDGPWVVKPARGGSTIGAAGAEDADELADAVDEALRFDDLALIEQFVTGREFSVGVLGENEPFPVLEASTHRDMFDYVAKYQQGEARETCPADIPSEVAEELQRQAVVVCRTLQLGESAFPRVDFRRDPQGTNHLLEVNGLAGMTPTSMWPKTAAAGGMDLPKVCDELVRRAAG